MKIKKIAREGQIFYEISKEDLDKLRKILIDEVEKIKKEERIKIKNDLVNYMAFL